MHQSLNLEGVRKLISIKVYLFFFPDILLFVYLIIKNENSKFQIRTRSTRIQCHELLHYKVKLEPCSCHLPKKMAFEWTP